VVVTEKMDGECTTMYRDWIHARSLDMLDNHPSRTWVKALWGQIRHRIPEGMIRICGENLYAVHSIRYEALPSYFLVHSVWMEEECWAWEETCRFARELGLEVVPARYRSWDLVRLFDWDSIQERQEGWVVRRAGRIRGSDYGRQVAKWVRAGHVQTDEHWLRRPVERNRLAVP
jgi:hypothetical protein